VLATPWPATEAAVKEPRRSVRQDIDGLHQSPRHGPGWLGARARPQHIGRRAGGGLARISQRDRCIGALDLRKSSWTNGLSQDQGESRCRQSVTRICLALHALKGVRRWHDHLGGRGDAARRHRWAAPIDRALCGLRTSVRRIKLAMPTAFPYQAEYHAALTAAVTV
jgi:hypothetical protein